MDCGSSFCSASVEVREVSKIRLLRPKLSATMPKCPDSAPSACELSGCHFETSASGRALSTSSLALILCSVPQGSVLGPILFLLYTADLRLLIEGHFICPHLYADDTHRLCRPSATLEFQNSIWNSCSQVDALQRAPGEYCKGQGSLVYIQSTPPSATRVGTDQVTPVSVFCNLGI